MAYMAYMEVKRLRSKSSERAPVRGLKRRGAGLIHHSDQDEEHSDRDGGPDGIDVHDDPTLPAVRVRTTGMAPLDRVLGAMHRCACWIDMLAPDSSAR